jgi:hypothetical protein
MKSTQRVTLCAQSRELRRCLGPLAWAVLEDVALDAEPGGGAMVARTSARQVAEHLDIQPGTAAKALQRLRDLGLVSLAREAGHAGRFGLSVYRLAPIAGLTITFDTEPCVDPPNMVAPHVAVPQAVEPPVDESRVARPDAAYTRMTGLSLADASVTGPVHPPPPTAAPVVSAPPEQAASESDRTTADGAPVQTVIAPKPSGRTRTVRKEPRGAAQGSLWDEP